MRTFGETGDDAATAGVTMDNLTGEISPRAGFSRTSTASTRLAPTAWAIEAAFTGDSSATEMVISTVFGSAEAVILFAREGGVSDRPKLSITGCSTTGVETVST
ncbi:hypothetical protein NtRootA9_29070 [Arthrobacter sp. NtRootA9]|nr:hypothetical protein NtRootA9_29070 [Arthrobacter sp. NtRootA9]